MKKGKKNIQEPLRVLMVDDSPSACRSISDMLAVIDDLTFMHLHDPTRALEAVADFDPSVIIQDLHMPEVDGLDLLRRYRNSPDFNNIPVLILSAERNDKVKAKAFSLGANDYLVKGEKNREEVVARVRYHAKRYHQLRSDRLVSRALMMHARHTVRVLMIDSSRAACLMVRRILTGEEDIEFRFCLQPERAICEVEEYLPTVILMAFVLEEHNSMELLASFRANRIIRDIPVIIFSATADPARKAMALEAGANDYIVKSSNILELIWRLRSLSSEYFNLMKARFSDEGTIDTENGTVRVLMVDDSRSACEMVGYLLKSEPGMIFAFCTDSGQALDKARDFSPTVILQDLEMPGINGLELLRLFREDPFTHDIPIVVLSVVSDPLIKAKVFACGANDYMEKGMDKIELLGRLQYHNRAYSNSLTLNRSIENLLDVRQRLQVQSNFIRRTFGRYLSDDIVSSILESPDGLELGGEKRVITIMMADLRGFTSIGERLPPETVLAIINNFLQTMTKILFRYGGTIDEFMGDAILAMFGAPHQHEDDASRAVACAVEMQLAMAEVNELNRKHGYPEVGMGIGLNTGEVVVGNIGSEMRSKYGIVGRNVNLTSRIESYTVGGQIFAADRTIRACGPIVRIDSRMEVMPKGVSQPLTIYEVGGIGGSFNIFLSEKKGVKMVELRDLLPIDFTVLEGKHAGIDRHEGRVSMISPRQALVSGKVLPERLANVKITLFDHFHALVCDDLYGKVVVLGEGGRNFLVEFTSIPPLAAAYLQRLLGRQSKEKKVSIRQVADRRQRTEDRRQDHDGVWGGGNV